MSPPKTPLAASLAVHALSRRTMLKAGALTVGFALAGLQARAEDAMPAPRTLDPNALDSFLMVDGDGTVTLFCGKVDLGQGLRIAMRQIAGEELGIGVDKIKYVEGDTALTPDQGRTSGSNGIQRGGMQIRRAAATAREALVALAAQRLNMAADDLIAVDGEVPGPKTAAREFALPISSAPAASISSSILKRRSKIPRPTHWSAGRCRARTCPPNARALSPICRISVCRT